MKHGLCLILVLLMGCTSLTPERVQTIVAIAGVAAQVGAAIWLDKHPDHRPAFNAVVTALQGLQANGNTNQAAFVSLLESLPTGQLTAPQGDLYWSGERLLIWDGELKKSVKVEGKAALPVMRATLSGLKRGVAPMPPAPRKTAKVKVDPTWFTSSEDRPAESRPGKNPFTLEAPPGLVTNNIHSPGHQILLYTNFTNTVILTGPPVLLIATKTNVTRSVIDVQHHAGSVPVISVRWRLGPDSIYQVQRDEGAEWLTFACVTNSTGTGPTNICFPWPTGVQVGSWRVLRIR